MPAQVAQDTFEIHLESNAFPCDDLRVRSVTGREKMSTLYGFDIEIVQMSAAPGLAAAMAGASATLVVEHVGHGTRRIPGVIVQVTDLFASDADLRVLRVRLVPRMFRLSLVDMQDVLMDLTVPEIIERKMAQVGLRRAHERRLLEKYPRREFVVQYSETDLAFVCRLAEHLGISFFFEEQDGADRVIFTDHPDGFEGARAGSGGAAGGMETLQFRARGEARDVFELSATATVIPAYYAARDYNDQLPHIDLTSEYRLRTGHAGGVCEYGSHHRTPEEGAMIARIRGEERQTGQLVYAGQSTVIGMRPGALFRVEGHPEMSTLDLLITEVEHTATQLTAMSGTGAAIGYRNTFRAIPADRPFRPERVTPRPRIHGLVHGVVDDGRTGVDQIAQIDEQGRYTVRFLFDLQSQPDRNASLPIRMLQAHVGENYGHHAPLKPGTEVLVGFVHGDPDRPIIVGAAHNPLSPTPVARKNATTHRIRTSGGVTIDIVDDP